MKSVLRRFIRESLVTEAVPSAQFFATKRRGGEEIKVDTRTKDSEGYGTVGDWISGASAALSAVSTYRKSRASNATVKSAAKSAWIGTSGKRKSILNLVVAAGALAVIGYAFFNDSSISEQDQGKKADEAMQKFHSGLDKILINTLQRSPSPRDDVRTPDILSATQGADSGALVAAHKLNYSARADALVSVTSFSDYNVKFGQLTNFSRMITEIESFVQDSIPDQIPENEKSDAKNALLKYAFHFLVIATTVDILEDAAKLDMDRAIQLVSSDKRSETNSQITVNSDQIFRKISDSTIFKEASKTFED